VALSPWLGLELGGSGYYGAYDPAGTQHVAMLGADASYTVGPAQVLAEYATVSTDGGTAGANAIPTSLDGLYVEGRYRFFPAFLDGTWLGQGGGFDHALFTLVGRAGYADTNHAAFDASDRQELLLGLNYRPIPNFVVKLEGQRLLQPAVGQTADTLWTSLAVGF
jgi:hypothetical protein